MDIKQIFSFNHETKNDHYKLHSSYKDLAALLQLAKVVATTEFKFDYKFTNYKKIISNSQKLLNIFTNLQKLLLNKQSLNQNAQWIIDNYYLLDKNFQLIEANLNNKLNCKLSNAYRICKLFIEHCDSEFDIKKFNAYIAEYQKYQELSICETVNLNLCLRIILLQNATYIAKITNDFHNIKYKAGKIAKNLSKQPKILAKIELESYKKTNDRVFITLLYNEVKDYKLKYLILQNYGLSYQDIINENININNIQSSHNITIANIINSIKKIDEFDWEKWLTKNCIIDIYLNNNSELALLTNESRSLLRSKIEEIAHFSNKTDFFITKLLINLLKEAPIENKNLGYFLLGEGRKLLEQKANFQKDFALKIKFMASKYSEKFFTISFIILSLIYLFLVNYLAIKNSKLSYLAQIGLNFCLLPFAIEFAFNIFHKIIQYIFSPQKLIGYDYSQNIPERAACLIAMPCLLNNKKSINKLIANLLSNYLLSPKGKIYFALISDFTDSKELNWEKDQELLNYAEQQIEKLNKKYAKNHQEKFFIFQRKKLFNAAQSCYMGWERKRGKLHELNKLLRNQETNFINIKKIPSNIKYILTLDEDTKLTPDSAAKLIGKIDYEYNKAKFCPQSNKVTQGYSILQPKISYNIENDNKRSLYHKIFARQSGFDPYLNAVSDHYQDLFHEGNYVGKAIYDIDNFEQALKDKIKENSILSHDLLEGCFARCAFVSDVELMEDYPNDYIKDSKRFCRWVRGDWQLLPYIWGKLTNNELTKNLSFLSLIKITDNLRRSLLPIFFVGLSFIAALNPGDIINYYFLPMVIFGYYSSIFINIINNILYFKKNIYLSSYLYSNFKNIIYCLGEIILRLIFMAYNAFYCLYAIIVTCYRLFISRKNLLEWRNFADISNKEIDFTDVIKTMLSSSFLGVITLYLSYKNILYNNWLVISLAFAWIIAPIVTYAIGKKANLKLDKKSQQYLTLLAKDIWLFYQDFCNKKSNFLPIDNYQEYDNKIAYRTSPTNIGMYLLAIVAAYEFKFINLNNALYRIEKCLESLKKLPRYRGHFYNWYNILNLRPLPNYTISTVDSGNLAGHLMTLYSALKNWQYKKAINKNQKYLTAKLAHEVKNFAEKMQFDFLIDKELGLLSIGYDVKNKKILPSCYDMLASEARLSYYFAISQGQIKAKIWQKMSRFLTCIKGQAALLSWSGSMFEYLMPSLIMRERQNSLLGQSNKLIIEKQIKHAIKSHKIWGVSEAAYNEFDNSQNYKYSDFGISDLRLQRNHLKNYVIAPYASIMALQHSPKKALKNLLALEKIGARSKYGFFDAIDFSDKTGSSYNLVKNYYSHHHGMSITAIYNLLHNNKMQDYFYHNVNVAAHDILLQEKAPDYVSFSNLKHVKNDITFNELDFSNYEISSKQEQKEYFLAIGTNQTIIFDNFGQINRENGKFNFEIEQADLSSYVTQQSDSVNFCLNHICFKKKLKNISSELQLIPIINNLHNDHNSGIGYQLKCKNESKINQKVAIKLILRTKQKIILSKNSKHQLLIISDSEYGKILLPKIKDTRWKITSETDKIICEISLTLKSYQEQNLHFWRLKHNNAKNLSYLMQHNAFDKESIKAWICAQAQLQHDNLDLAELHYSQVLFNQLQQNYNNFIIQIKSEKDYNKLKDIFSSLAFYQKNYYNHAKITIQTKKGLINKIEALSKYYQLKNIIYRQY